MGSSRFPGGIPCGNIFSPHGGEANSDSEENQVEMRDRKKARLDQQQLETETPEVPPEFTLVSKGTKQPPQQVNNIIPINNRNGILNNFAANDPSCSQTPAYYNKNTSINKTFTDQIANVLKHRNFTVQYFNKVPRIRK